MRRGARIGHHRDQASRRAQRSRRRAAAVGALLARRPQLGGAIGGALATALVPLEVAAWRRGMPAGVEHRRPRRARLLAYAAVAAGAALQSLSRTGGPLCRPDSPWQGHAGWHLATAGALGAWATSTLRP